MTDKVSGTITVVEKEPEFEVSGLEPKQTEVEVGETIDVTATVENVGGAGTAAVSFVMGDDDVEVRNRKQTHDLGAGESVSVSFNDVETDGLEPGEYTHSVEAVRDTDPAPGEPPEQSSAVQSFSNESPSAGEAVNVTVEIPIESDSNVAADYGLKFRPNFASTELVGAAFDGSSVSPDVRVVAPDSFLFASQEELTTGTLTINYRVTVPEDAEAGDEYEFYQIAAQVDGTEIEVDGPTVLTVADNTQSVSAE